MPDLDDWLTRASLFEYAGSTIFQRGEGYFLRGAVNRLFDAGDKVSARVSGTYPYRVELWTDGEEFHYDCTCPHAAEGNFCKHCVALGLAWLDRRARGFDPGSPEESSWDAIRHYLERQPQHVLVEWLWKKPSNAVRYTANWCQRFNAGGIWGAD